VRPIAGQELSLQPGSWLPATTPSALCVARGDGTRWTRLGQPVPEAASMHDHGRERVQRPPRLSQSWVTGAAQLPALIVGGALLCAALRQRSLPSEEKKGSFVRAVFFPDNPQNFKTKTALHTVCPLLVMASRSCWKCLSRFAVSPTSYRIGNVQQGSSLALFSTSPSLRTNPPKKNLYPNRIRLGQARP
jgi:hypothetical protein